MKKLAGIFLTIYFLSFLFITNTNAQNTFAIGVGGGFVGIGTLAPFNQLEVTKGDINIAPFGGVNYGYKIGTGAGSPYVLWHNGIITNIYVGVGAGNLNATNSNTFIGYNTGILSGTTSTTGIVGSSPAVTELLHQLFILSFIKYNKTNHASTDICPLFSSSVIFIHFTRLIV